MLPAGLLQEVTTHGFISEYSGIRIAADGRRFRIRGALVWNVYDDRGDAAGQAAMFAVPDVEWLT